MKSKRVTNYPPDVAGARPTDLASEVRELILSARQTVARGVNTALVVLDWKVGQPKRSKTL